VGTQSPGPFDLLCSQSLLEHRASAIRSGIYSTCTGRTISTPAARWAPACIRRRSGRSWPDSCTPPGYALLSSRAHRFVTARPLAPPPPLPKRHRSRHPAAAPVTARRPLLASPALVSRWVKFVRAVLAVKFTALGGAAASPACTTCPCSSRQLPALIGTTSWYGANGSALNDATLDDEPPKRQLKHCSCDAPQQTRPGAMAHCRANDSSAAPPSVVR
jgi:hypothetical protein